MDSWMDGFWRGALDCFGNPVIHSCSYPAFSYVLHWPPIATNQDEAIRIFLPVPGAIAFCQQAPRGSQLLPAAARFRLAGATTIWMVNRIPRYAAVYRADAAMPRAPGFA